MCVITAHRKALFEQRPNQIFMPHNTSLLLVSIHHKVKHGITRDERAIEVINVGPIVDYSIKFDEVLKPLKVSVFG